MTFLSPLAGIFAANPTVRAVQGALLILAVIDVFLVLYTLRDMLLRTRSFLYQFVCILLVAALPGVGFLFYLLIRPSRTLQQRETEAVVRQMAAVVLGLDNEEIEEDIEGQQKPDVPDQ